MNSFYLEIGSNNSRCRECGCVLEAGEHKLCHACKSDLTLSGGVEMFDYEAELSLPLLMNG